MRHKDRQERDSHKDSAKESWRKTESEIKTETEIRIKRFMHSLYKCLLSTHCVPSTVLVLGILKRAGQMPALEETQRERLIRESDKMSWVGPREGTPHRPPTVLWSQCPGSRGPALNPLPVTWVPRQRKPDRSGDLGQSQRAGKQGSGR